jgi:colicin import membrane protein
MKNILLALLFFLIPIIVNGQTQEATTSDGKKVILNADGTWKYAHEVTTSDGKKVILNADGTWKYAEVKKVNPEAENKQLEKLEADRKLKEQLEAERKRVEAEQTRQADILNKTREALANSKNVGTTSTSIGEAGEMGNQGNFSYDLGGRGFLSLPKPNYDYQEEGRVVVEVSVDRKGKVIQAIPGVKGSTTFDKYLLEVAKEAAMKARFESRSDAPAIQKGTITYNFMLR